MSTVIVDYGVGNLFSLKQSLLKLGEDTVVSGSFDVIAGARRVILPGVGAFGDAAQKLRDSGLDAAVIRAAGNGTPLLGICLGMQLLFEQSYEFGQHRGLGLIPGEVRSIRETVDDAPASGGPTAGTAIRRPLQSVTHIPSNGVSLKIPQIGWNKLVYRRESPIYNGMSGGYVYFVHSYHAVCPPEYITAETEYGAFLTASVQKANVFGTQYHPEKSGDFGLKILEAFLSVSRM